MADIVSVLRCNDVLACSEVLFLFPMYAGKEEVPFCLKKEHVIFFMRYFYGVRNVLSHGSSHRTFASGGALNGLIEKLESCKTFTPIARKRHGRGRGGGTRTYFEHKLVTLRDCGRRWNPGYDFLLAAHRLLKSFAIMFERSFSELEKAGVETWPRRPFEQPKPK